MWYTDGAMNVLLSKNKKSLTVVAITFIATLLLYLFVFAFGGIYPFGDGSLTYRDGDTQYIDLLLYFKNALLGKDSVFFSMSKYLGGNMYAAFTYYLASPFSLIALFFDKGNIALCVNLLVLIKSCVASSCVATFLTFRFDKKLPLWVTVLLSTSYSLSQYFIPQSSNFMWLDGAYMLPLMLLGVYLCINGKSTLLIISTALSLIFNWYTGIINCAFTAFWALYEWLSIKRQNGLFKAVRRYIIAMLTGVLVSGIVLIPSLLSLSGRTHGSSSIADVFSLGFIGSPLSYFGNYGPGIISIEGSVSVYAGSFVLVSSILYFVVSKYSKRELISNAILMAFGVLMFYWWPLVFIFSVFREVESFWYRYGYLGIFILVFIAALFWANPKKKINKYPIIAVVLFDILSIIGSALAINKSQKAIFDLEAGTLFNNPGDYSILSYSLNAILPIIMLGIIYLIVKASRDNRIIKICCCVLLGIELTLNATLLLVFYSKDNYQSINEYTPREEEILSFINKDYGDSSLYRISQTSNRSKHNNTLELAYNEALSYGFNGISSFLSSPEETQGLFMQNLGYSFASDTIPIITNTNLAVDSLLGVQYVLSDYDIPGGIQLTNNSGFKNAYANPYALPMAFVVPDQIESPDFGDNPFENINRVYSDLTGIESLIFEPAQFVFDGETYTVAASNGNPVYGYFEMDEESSGTLSVEGWGEASYNVLFAPTVFVVPTSNGTGSFTFDGTVEDVVLYELNLEALMACSEIVNNEAGSIAEISNNEYVASIEVEAPRNIMLLIPYQDYMSVEVNGEKVEVDTYASVFPIVHVETGFNEIYVKYSAPYMSAGVVVTVVGLLMLVLVIVIEKKCDIIQTIILKKRV